MLSVNLVIINIVFIINTELTIFFINLIKSQENVKNNLDKIKNDLLIFIIDSHQIMNNNNNNKTSLNYNNINNNYYIKIINSSEFELNNVEIIKIVKNIELMLDDNEFFLSTQSKMFIKIKNFLNYFKLYEFIHYKSIYNIDRSFFNLNNLITELKLTISTINLLLNYNKSYN